MATRHEIPAELRKDEGKGASRRLRRSGTVPAILYGAKEAPVNLQFHHNTVLLASNNEWFYSAILDLNIEGKTQKVLLRDMQRHPFKPQILHLDFQRVSENEAIRVRVPLHFINQQTSPAGKIAGSVITHELNEVTISCLPKDLPEFIEVDLAQLEIGDIVHLSDIPLPAGVVIPELRLGKEHDHAVAIAKMARAEEEPAAAAAEAAPAAAPAAKAAPAKAAPAKAAPAKAAPKK
ncbi:MAG: 50S ribosomal protein L25/general stress protein Ctc [Xanthomonadaceae bacterium]|nr:50S ribosomal protein L25/general stress protein Ctc [Xanthomonadaceae bacterium]